MHHYASALTAKHSENNMIDMSDNRSVNDIGGLLDEPFNPQEHDYEPWEKRVHALRELLAIKGLLSADVLRKNIEILGAEKYKNLSYYERWIHSISQAMLERGALSNKELADKINEVKLRYE